MFDWYLSHRVPTILIKPKKKTPIAREWQKKEIRNRTSVKDTNLGMLCGTEFENGQYIHVIDIDPDNGGIESFTELANKFDFPDTVIVKTGSSGKHYYYLADEPIGKCKLAKGIDFQGAGAYVVCAGSIHPNGNSYEFESEPGYVEVMPPSLMEFIKAKRGDHRGLAYDTADYTTLDDELTNTKFKKGERNDGMTAVAGRLRRTGFDAKMIFSALKSANAELCDEPLPDSELRTIAKSVSRYAPEQTEPVTTKPIKKQEPKTLDKRNLTSVEDMLDEAWYHMDGLFKELATECMAAAPRKYPQIAMSAAYSLICAAAQGSAYLPPLKEGHRRGAGFSSFIWCSEPSAAGKDIYRHFVELYASAVCEHMPTGNFGSGHGLRASLFGWNSRLWVIDEFQDELKKMSGAGSVTGQILTDLKILANAPDKLNEVLLKDKIYPAILRPGFSIFALGTTHGFNKLLGSDIIANGLLSRFLVLPSLDVPKEVEPDVDLFEADDAKVIKLQGIFDRGLTDKGKSGEYDYDMQRFFALNDAKRRTKDMTYDHEPQTKPNFILGFEEGCRELYRAIAQENSEKYREMVNKNDENAAISPASVVGRQTLHILRIAGAHALGCNRPNINEKDLTVARWLAGASTRYMVKSIRLNAFERYDDIAANKIKSVLSGKDEPMSKRDIMRGCKALRSKDCDEALMNMALSGVLLAVKTNNSSGEIEEIENVESLKKFPRGTKFVFAEGECYD